MDHSGYDIIRSMSEWDRLKVKTLVPIMGELTLYSECVLIAKSILFFLLWLCLKFAESREGGGEGCSFLTEICFHNTNTIYNAATISCGAEKHRQITMTTVSIEKFLK